MSSGHGASLMVNYVFSALAGLTWYCQFMFYGMGTTNMGKYDFSSWTIHMAFIIAFSNVWGLLLHEWKGASGRTHRIVFAGILTLVISTMIVGAGSYMKKTEDARSPKVSCVQPGVGKRVSRYNGDRSQLLIVRR